MELSSRAVLNRLLFLECEEVQKRVTEEIDAIEDLNGKINTKNVSEATMVATIVRIRKEVTGSYKLKG